MSQKKSVSRQELTSYLTELFRLREYEDYGPNGLQIEGRDQIEKIAFAVSATAHTVSEAVKQKADALIVHHGLFWKFHGPRAITGTFAKRVSPLIKNDINLYGLHLPLDGHPVLGNAATLANLLGLKDLEDFGLRSGLPTGIKGKFLTPIKASALKEKLAGVLKHTVMHSSPDDNQDIFTMGIITGGANSEWKLAQREGLDSYLTGEMSEHDWNEAQEAGMHMYAGGHHATERFGVQSLMEHLKSRYQIEAVFFDSENPA